MQTLDDVTLHEHLRLMNEANGSLFWSYLRRPLVVAVAGLVRYLIYVVHEQSKSLYVSASSFKIIR